MVQLRHDRRLFTTTLCGNGLFSTWKVIKCLKSSVLTMIGTACNKLGAEEGYKVGWAEAPKLIYFWLYFPASNYYVRSACGGLLLSAFELCTFRAQKLVHFSWNRPSKLYVLLHKTELFLFGVGDAKNSSTCSTVMVNLRFIPYHKIFQCTWAKIYFFIPVI